MAGYRTAPVASGCAHRPWADLPVVAACSAVVAACMLFSVSAAPQQEVASAVQSGDAALSQKQADPMVEGEVIASYNAISQNVDADRAENVRLAAEAIDGAVIAPGETFSFNDHVGNTGEDPAYRMAPIIYGNQMVDGRGGGICQVSTALYIAALKANLEIVERHQHTIASDYAPMGLDATLDYGVMDLRIRNASDEPVRIQAKAMGQTVEVAIVGKPLAGGLSVDATSHIVDRFTASGVGGEAVCYVTEAYRVYYVDGVKQRSELLSSDTYLVTDRTSVVPSEGGVDSTK